MTIVICIIIIDEKIKEKLLSAQLSECQLGTGLLNIQYMRTWGVVNMKNLLMM